MGKVLTIQRSRWRRGGDGQEMINAYGVTALLNEKGMMCCLGFDALACGLTEEQIRGVSTPYEIDLIDIPDTYDVKLRVVDRQSSEDGCHHLDGTPAVNNAVAANDSPNITEPERETRVKNALLQLGWDDVMFED